MSDDFFSQGWRRFSHCDALLKWVQHAKPLADNATRDVALRTNWLRSGGTWFVGVNALANDGDGRLENGPKLSGELRDFVDATYGWHALDHAQVSITYPGYPQPDPWETDAAYRFRRNRDAAHLDGIKPELEGGRRCVDEPHAYVIGVPLNAANIEASPLVVWPGSHKILQCAMRDAFEGVAPEAMRRHDVTEAYRAARAQVFDRCSRVEVSAKPGEAYMLHRHLLHGVAPWQEGAIAPEEGRMIAYFRPAFPDVQTWLTRP